MKRQIDINCDMGEWYKSARQLKDDQIMPYISSCNIACTYHSGDEHSMRTTVRSAMNHQVSIGAHPSYKDPENFGRIPLQIPLAVLKEDILIQLDLLTTICKSEGTDLNHVKPHGALYHKVATDQDIAYMFFETIAAFNPALKIYILADAPTTNIADQYPMQILHEAFIDRKYIKNKRLKSRSYDDAVLSQTNDIKFQLSHLLNNQIMIDGEKEAISVDTICLHSDTPNAVSIAAFIHQQLTKENIEINSVK